MTDSEKIQALEQILKPVTEWYAKVLAEGEPDISYLYDTTYEVFNDNLTSGDFQNIIATLLAPKPTKEQE